MRLQHAQNLLAGVAATWTGVFDAANGYEEHGAPTLGAWARRDLRVTAAESRRRTKRAGALDRLRLVQDAFGAGRIGLAHLDVLAHGLHQLGTDTMTAVEPVLVEVAETCDADVLRQAVRQTRDTLDPDAADAAYLAALERRDIAVTPVGEGFQVRGFLDPETGAAFQTVLAACGSKVDADDDRPSGHRRVDGLRQLCTGLLDHGLPTDRGLRPHLFVTVNADRLSTAVNGQEPSGPPAVLHRYGPINDTVLARLACDCVFTEVPVDSRGNALDVGRTSRLATLKQRQAIFVQQGGVCFNPGCDRTGLEIHHMVPWSLGGRTDLRDLRGYCTRCHHLIHLGRLIIKPDRNQGWTHHTKHAVHLPQHQRRAGHLTRIYLQALAHAGRQHALRVTQDYRRSRGHTVIRS